MAHYFSRKIAVPFEEAVQKITENLRRHGFNRVTEIDLRDSFENDLDLKFRRYKILSACDPRLAYQAITLESHIGMMLPYNIVVQEHENREVEISSCNPLQVPVEFLTTSQLADLLYNASNRVRCAIDDLHRDCAEPGHLEALPVEDCYHPCESVSENFAFVQKG